MKLEEFLEQYLHHYKERLEEHAKLGQLQPARDCDFERKYFEEANKNRERQHVKEVKMAFEKGKGEGLKAASTWVSVNDAFPKERRVILMLAKSGNYHVGYFNDGQWYCQTSWGEDVEVINIICWQGILN
jgi:hypothetical protein